MATEQTDDRQLRQFAITIGFALPLFLGLLLPWLWGRALPWWPWIAGIAVITVGWLMPALLRPIYLAWMWFAHWLGRVNTVVVLTVVYFLLITPFSVVRRLFGSDSLHLRSADVASYLQVRDRAPGPTDMERPY